MKEGKAPCHIPENWLYDDGLSGSDVNPIIEEIMVILTKQKITIKTAKQILEDTIKVIDQEAILKDRKVMGKII